jgi:hypothetical protein
MTSTLIPTCSLCGLRFANGALLDLHIREDHVEGRRQAEPGHGDSGDAGTSEARTAGPPRSSRPASGQPRATPEVSGTTAAQRPGSGWAKSIIRRTVSALGLRKDRP